MTDYLESNQLLPDNQHGFRKKRSTMSAWESIQQDWANKTDEKLTTGVLLWDLTAAFDTLDSGILCNKLNISNYPLKVDRQTINQQGTSTRAGTSGRLIESGKSCLSQKTCINDAIRIWNQLPSVATDCKTLSQLKNTTKTYIKTLPI